MAESTTSAWAATVRPIWELNELPCREAPSGSAHQVKGRERRGPRREETTMAKYLLFEKNDEYTPQELAGGRS